MLKPIEKAILEHCKTGGSLTPLRARFKKTPLYDAAERLVDEGLLRKVRRNHYETTPEGLRRLDAESAGGSEGETDPIEALWPPAALLPTLVHRALVRLIVLAIAVRTRGMADSHLANFGLVGPTLSGKSTLAKLVCLMFGVPPEVGVVNAVAEGGRSLDIRRTARGTISTRRRILSLPFFALDELHRASPDVRRSLLLHLAGEKVLAFENTTLTVAATCLAVMNPIAQRDEGLEKRTGFDEPTIRRTIIADLEGLRMPADWRVRGARILEAASRMGPIHLPEVPSAVAIPAEAVAKRIDRVVKPAYTRLVDVEMIVVLCRAAAALGIGDPVSYVLYQYGTIVETLQWTKEGWRDAFRAASGRPEPAPNFEPSELGRQILAVAGDGSSVAFAAKAAEFYRLADKTTLSPQSIVAYAEERHRRRLEGYTRRLEDAVYRQWKARGRDVRKTVATIDRLLTRYASLERAVAGKRAELEAKAKELLESERRRQEVDQRRQEIERRIAAFGGEGHLELAIDVHGRLHRLGFTIESAGPFLEGFLAAGTRAGLSPEETGKRAAELILTHPDAHRMEADHKKRVEELQARAAEEERKAAAARAAVAVAARLRVEAERTCGELKQKNADLARHSHDVASELAAKAEELKGLIGNAGSLEEAIARARKREESAATAKAALEARGREFVERGKALDADEAALRSKAEELERRERELAEDVDAGRVSMALLWREFGRYGSAVSAEAFRRLASAAEIRDVIPVRYYTIDPDRYRAALLRLAKPHIDREYVPRRDHERGVHALTRRVEERDATIAGKDDVIGKLTEENKALGEKLATFETWFKDPGKATPAQTAFVFRHYGEIFGDRVERAWNLSKRSPVGATLYCPACHEGYRKTLPGLEELYNTMQKGWVYDLTCRCGRKNTFDARVLIVAVGGPAMPKE